MLNIVGERERPNLPVMFGLHNVLSAHSFPFVKQDLATCRRYITYWQNGEQVSRTVHLAFSTRQSWSTRQLACSSMCTSNPSVFASCTLEP